MPVCLPFVAQFMPEIHLNLVVSYSGIVGVDKLHPVVSVSVPPLLYGSSLGDFKNNFGLGKLVQPINLKYLLKETLLWSNRL